MQKRLLMLISLACLGWAQQTSTQVPACKPLSYFGVHGCEPSAEGKCLKGYHKQAACPPNPMMKVPCRQVCVADVPSKKDAPKAVDTCIKR